MQAKTEATTAGERLRLVEQEVPRLGAELHDSRKSSAEFERRAITAEAALAATQQRITEYKEADAERKGEIAALRDELREATAKINAEVERRAAAEQRCALLDIREKSNEATPA